MIPILSWMFCPNRFRLLLKNGTGTLSRVLLCGIISIIGFMLLTCQGPSSPDFTNVYDPESDNYIPTPDINTAPVTGIRTFQAESGGAFETDYGKPVTAKGVCWSTEKDPSVEDDCTNDGQGLDAFTSVMDGLEPDQTYYVRAYATNEAGTIYGGQRTFTTQDGRPIIFIELESKTAFSIRVKGDIVSEIETAQITSYGVCYDEEPNPDRNSECVSHDGETGSYFIELDGLAAGISYYVYAYAVNEIGTGSSELIEISTRDGIPVLKTIQPFDIWGNSARTGGEVTDDGGAEIIERGVCYVEGNGEPGLSDCCVNAGTGTGSFQVLLEELEANQQYIVRAYAKTDAGTGWGQAQEFTTLWPRDTDTEVVEVTNPVTGQVWMDRNLGASRAATSSTDEQAFGDFYQWGRGADGHQKRNSSTTGNLSSTDQPNHGNFILSNSDANWDWRNPQNDNLWHGVNGINNPCPAGYRLPTEAEWQEERQSWASNDASGAFASPLKLPMAGYRNYSSGSLFDVGSYGNYWSSSVSGSYARALYFNSSFAAMDSSYRAFGDSVRCLED